MYAMARRQLFHRYLCAVALLSFSLLLSKSSARILQTRVAGTTRTHSDGKRFARVAQGRLYLSLKHRDAPNSPFVQPRYKSRQELLQIVLERDEVRATAFRDRVLQRPPRLVREMETEDKLVAMATRSPLDPMDEGVGAWLVPPTGAGEYYTELYVGTPRQLQVVMVDFASDVVWLGKKATDDTVKNLHFFDPSSSSSFTPISNACVASEEAMVTSQRSLKFAYDDIWLNRTLAHKHNLLRAILLAVSPVQVPTGGVLGLGRGKTSLATQIQHTVATFAYCLADTDEPSGSLLIFGAAVDPHLAFTPLVTHPHVHSFYMVNLMAVEVNRVPLPIPSHVFRLSRDGRQGGTIVDISTRFTRLPECAFRHVVRAVEASILLPTTDPVPGFHLCYSTSNSNAILQRVPTLSLVWEHGARMALPVENLFVLASERGDVICLAMVPGRPGSATVIGSTQQQNFFMLVDRRGSRLGFAPRQCASFPKL